MHKHTVDSPVSVRSLNGDNTFITRMLCNNMRCHIIIHRQLLLFLTVGLPTITIVQQVLSQLIQR